MSLVVFWVGSSLLLAWCWSRVARQRPPVVDFAEWETELKETE